MKRSLKYLLALFLVSAPVFATVQQQDPIFTSYEQVRQALLRDSVAQVKSAASTLTAAAHSVPAVAQNAAALQKAGDLSAARQAFAALSVEIIKYRDGRPGSRPSVVYCPMVKKSWVQPKGEIGNPYAEAASMKKCGSITRE